MNPLLILSISMTCGLIIAKLLNHFKLPAVTGYLIAGLLLGPSFFNIISHEAMMELDFISEIALGLIAFHIGGNFSIPHIKKLGKQVITITFFQAFITTILVTIVVYLFSKNFAFSIMLGAISAATAPAATLMVIREFKAKGPLTETLIAVVALDDMLCLFIFSIASAIAKIFESNIFSLKTALLVPFLELGGSILLGCFLGFLVVYMAKKSKATNELMVLAASAILLGSGIAQLLHLSELLTCMSIGAIIANLAKNHYRIFDIVESITPPIYILFFTMAGIHLDITVLKTIGVLGIFYILARALGKFIGSYIGSVVSNAPIVVKKYLGIGLLPQAGVAIGLSMIVGMTFPSFGQTLTNLVMGAVFVYEIIGPICTRIILTRAGEIQIDTSKK